MDNRDFDALTRNLVRATQGRRVVLHTLLAGVAAAVSAHVWGSDGAAKKDDKPDCYLENWACDGNDECCSGKCCGHSCCAKNKKFQCCDPKKKNISCADVSRSTKHCGKCGHKCQPGAECKNGKCRKPADPCPKCEPDEVCEDGHCVKCDCPLGQVCNHGTCTLDEQCQVPNGCPEENIYGTSTCCGERCCDVHSSCCGGECCEYPRECIDGRCVCPTAQQCGDNCCDSDEDTCCDGTCVAFGYDENREHCETCGDACAPGEICCDVGPPEGRRCLSPKECCEWKTRVFGDVWTRCGDGPDATCCVEGSTCCGGSCIYEGDICCDGVPSWGGSEESCGGCGNVCAPNEMCCWVGDYPDHVRKCVDRAECCAILSKDEGETLVPCGDGDWRWCCPPEGSPCGDGCSEAAKRKRPPGQDGKNGGRSKRGAARPGKPPRRDRKPAKRARSGAGR